MKTETRMFLSGLTMISFFLYLGLNQSLYIATLPIWGTLAACGTVHLCFGAGMLVHLLTKAKSTKKIQSSPDESKD